MKTTKETKITVTLVLDEREATWLKSVMQNPLHDVHPDDEEEYSKEMRYKFWHALDDF